MTDRFYIGNELVGTFRPSVPIEGDIHINDFTVQRNGPRLFLVGAVRISLEPLDDDAKNLINNFSAEPMEFNESIYRMYPVDNQLVIILYTYNTVIRLDGDRKFIVHLRRSDEDRICKEGLAKLKADSPEGIPKLLSDIFISHGSIFMVDNENNNGRYQLMGDGYVANLIMERPGVYVIDRLRHPMKTPVLSLIQIFGRDNIRFVQSYEALSEKGNEDSIIPPVGTSKIFEAWNEYMGFEGKVYEDDVGSSIRTFHDLKIVEGSLRLSMNDPAEYEEIADTEFEMISTSQLGDSANPYRRWDEIKEFKSGQRPLYLDRVRSVSDDGRTVVFDLPRSGMDEDFISHGGTIYRSDFSILNAKWRRDKVLSTIRSKKNRSANIITRLGDVDVEDSQVKGTEKPITSATLKAMFGDTDFKLDETYREAMDIAINTPDIALIQGPPGTGKTTLILGLVTRLTEKYGNKRDFHILVSSEQHVALKNVVSKLSGSDLLPPFVSSQKFNDDPLNDRDNLLDAINKFKDRCISVCDDILQETASKDRYSENLARTVFIVQDIQNKNCSMNSIREHMEELEDLTRRMACSHCLLELKAAVDANTNLGNEPPDSVLGYILRKIESQRTILDAYLGDDGKAQLESLQTTLTAFGYDEYKMPYEMLQVMTEGTQQEFEKTFPLYCRYVDGLKEAFTQTPRNGLEGNRGSASDLMDKFLNDVISSSKSRAKNFYDIIERFSFEISDVSVVEDAIRRYTTVIGSTCAQADKSAGMSDSKRYDYVIIDEAARANPLDIMIPMIMGTRVLLVGDQYQLPHYIENEVLRKMRDEKDRYLEFDEELLTRSFFQILYENLEKAFADKRIRCRRTVMLDKQHRMHPIIGDFISKEFYQERIRNDDETERNRNDYNVFEGKNIVCIDVPRTKGFEHKTNGAISRKVEAEKVLEILLELIRKNPGRQLNIGVITFYKEQVRVIKELMDQELPENEAGTIECNTVDSFQGREFDIVLLSGVRSNLDPDHQRLGFIGHSDSRVNVSLSRAKRLLVFVGDVSTFIVNRHFQALFEYAKKVGHYE